MVRAALLAFSLACCSASAVLASDAAAKRCEAIELFGQDDYDELVCAGLAKFERQDYAGAAILYENALKIPLYEAPNFQIFPKLALAHYRAGNIDKAKIALRKAELTLMVFTRILQCREIPGGYELVQNVWGDPRKIDSNFHDEVMDIMCGAAYERIYRPEKIEELGPQGAAITNFLQAKREIDP